MSDVERVIIYKEKVFDWITQVNLIFWLLDQLTADHVPINEIKVKSAAVLTDKDIEVRRRTKGHSIFYAYSMLWGNWIDVSELFLTGKEVEFIDRIWMNLGSHEGNSHKSRIC